jgi:hypothetical protein
MDIFKRKMHVSKSIQLLEMLTFTSILPFEMLVCNFHQIRMPSTTLVKIAEVFFVVDLFALNKCCLRNLKVARMHHTLKVCDSLQLYSGANTTKFINHSCIWFPNVWNHRDITCILH